MALKIRGSSFFETCILVVTDMGVKHTQAVLGGGTKKFAFGQIEAILMSPSHVLSFQVGKEVFSVQTKPLNQKHQEVIDTLVRKVREAHGEVPGGPSSLVP